MTDYYVYSGAAGTGDGSSWTNAYTTLATALGSKTASDRLFVANDHAESQASVMTLTAPSSFGLQIICASRTGSVPPVAADLATTATITTTGANNMSFVGCAYVYGITFSAGSGGVNAGITFASASYWRWDFERCVLKHPSTNAQIVGIGSTSGTAANGFLSLTDCQFYFGNTGQLLRLNFASLSVRGSGLGAFLATSSAVPSTLISTINAPGPDVEFRGVDLSQISGNLVNASLSARLEVLFENCRLHASATVITGTIPNPRLTRVSLVNCAVNDGTPPIDTRRAETYVYAGSLVNSATIYKTATEGGVAPFSVKMTGNASTSRLSTLDLPIDFWNEDTGAALTISVDVLADDGAALDDDDVWLDVEYLGTSGSVKSSFANDGPATPLTTGSARSGTTDPGDWTGATTGAKKYTLSASVTPQEKGLIRATVRLAKASQVLYADPKPSVA